MRYAALDECRRFYAGDEAPDEDVEVVQGAASRTVAALASSPPDLDAGELPDPEYDSAMKETELLVGRWIWRSDGGSLSSKNVGGVVSKSWVDVAAIRSLAQASLGDYFAPDAEDVEGGLGGRFLSIPLERG